MGIKEARKKIWKFVGSFDPNTNDNAIFNKLLDEFEKECREAHKSEVKEKKQ